MLFQEYKHKPNKKILIIQPMVGSCLGHVMLLFFLGGVSGMLITSPESFLINFCYMLILLSIPFIVGMFRGSGESLQRKAERPRKPPTQGNKRRRLKLLKRGSSKTARSLLMKLPKAKSFPEQDLNIPQGLIGHRMIFTQTNFHMQNVSFRWDELEAMTYIPGQETGATNPRSGERAITPSVITFKINGVESRTDFTWGFEGGEIQSFRPLNEEKIIRLLEQFHEAPSEEARADLIKQFHEHPESTMEKKKIHPKVFFGAIYFILISLFIISIYFQWDKIDWFGN
jgi:hypothetical protein